MPKAFKLLRWSLGYWEVLWLLQEFGWGGGTPGIFVQTRPNTLDPNPPKVLVLWVWKINIGGSCNNNTQRCLPSKKFYPRSKKAIWRKNYFWHFLPIKKTTNSCNSGDWIKRKASVRSISICLSCFRQDETSVNERTLGRRHLACVWFAKKLWILWKKGFRNGTRSAFFYCGLRALVENFQAGVAVVDSIQMGSNYPDMSSGISAKLEAESRLKWLDWQAGPAGLAEEWGYKSELPFLAIPVFNWLDFEL